MTEFKDTAKSNEETDIELQPIANMNVSDSKNDDNYVLNNRKNVFSNVLYVSILKLSSRTSRSSNIPAYVPLQLASPILQVSESEPAMSQGDLLIWESLEKFREKRVLTINLQMTVLKGHCHHQKQQYWGKNQGFLLDLHCQSMKQIYAETSSISAEKLDVYCVSGMKTRKMLVKHPSLI